MEDLRGAGTVFSSPAPVAVGESFEPRRPHAEGGGCEMASIAWTKEHLPWMTPHLERLEAVADVSDHIVDVRACFMPRQSYLGLPFWHIDFYKPHQTPAGDLYYMSQSSNDTGHTDYLVGTYEWPGSWQRFCGEHHDDTPTGHMPDGQWHRFGGMTLHKASVTTRPTRRLFVRVRPGGRVANTRIHGVPVYMDLARAMKEATW